MTLLRGITLGLLSSALSLAWLFLGGIFAWGYYSRGWEHYVAAFFALPFAAAGYVPVTHELQFAISIIIIFVCCTLIIVVLNRVLQSAFRRK